MPTHQQQNVLVGVEHYIDDDDDMMHTYIKVVLPNVETTQLNPAAVLSGLNNWVLMIVWNPSCYP